MDLGAGSVTKYHFGPGLAMGNIDPIVDGTSDIIIMPDGVETGVPNSMPEVNFLTATTLSVIH